MAQCLFKLLKQKNPSCVIDVLAPAWTFSLLTRMPEVNDAIELPFAHGELKLRERYQLAKQLQKRHYQQAIVLPNSLKAALIPWLAKIPVRTGWRGEYRYGLINDMRHLNKAHHPLMIEQFMALGLPNDIPVPKPYPLPEFAISSTSQEQTLAQIQPYYRGRPILAVCAGAEFGPSKRWPAEYYAQVANAMLDKDWDVWLLGSPKDRAITDEIMQLTANRCSNIAGKPMLAQTIDLLSLVSGVITNDSGLMHVASALNKPIIAIYGSTSPKFTPPLGDKATILQRKLNCQPCFKRSCPLKHHLCMRDITPEEVLKQMSTWSNV